MTAYIEEFLYRGRDAEHEKSQEATFHVVLANWSAGPDGKPQIMRSPPLTPEKAEEVGFTLERILGEIANAAVLQHAKERTAREKAETERDVAKAEWSEMAAAVKKAEDAKVEAEKAAGALAQVLQTEREEKSAIIAELAEATKPPEGPSNPLLHKLTLGLAGK